MRHNKFLGAYQKIIAKRELTKDDWEAIRESLKKQIEGFPVMGYDKVLCPDCGASLRSITLSGRFKYCETGLFKHCERCGKKIWL